MGCVLVHGLGQTAESWKAVAFSLNRADIFCPNLYDLTKDKSLSYDSLYLGFSDYCSGLDGAIDLCGLSLGGVLSLNFALDHPEKVRTLVLIAAQYRMPKHILRLQNILFRLMPKGMFALTGFSRKDMISLCASMTELDFSGSLPKIHCPVLIICGKKDTANSRPSETLAEHISSAQLATVPGSGHEVNLDAPEQLADLLQSFYNATL